MGILSLPNPKPVRTLSPAAAQAVEFHCTEQEGRALPGKINLVTAQSVEPEHKQERLVLRDVMDTLSSAILKWRWGSQKYPVLHPRHYMHIQHPMHIYTADHNVNLIWD
jgi:hypothetical protein